MLFPKSIPARYRLEPNEKVMAKAVWYLLSEVEPGKLLLSVEPSPQYLEMLALYALKYVRHRSIDGLSEKAGEIMTAFMPEGMSENLQEYLVDMISETSLLRRANMSSSLLSTGASCLEEIEWGDYDEEVTDLLQDASDWMIKAMGALMDVEMHLEGKEKIQICD